jgi:hypothetical protein
MFMVGSTADEATDFMEYRSQIQNQLHALIELVFLHQIGEQFSTEGRDMPRMGFVERKASSEVDCGSNDLVSQFDSPGIAYREFRQEAVS